MMAENTWREENIDIEKVTLDTNLQIRVKEDQERIKDFVQVYDQLPPVKIIKEGDKLYLADGHHTYKAAKEKKERTLRALIREGKYSDALEVAVVGNAKGSLNLTREDKRRAIEKLLQFFPQRANSWVAEDVGVSMQTVESVRKELETKGTLKHYDDLLRRDQKTTPREYQKPIRTEAVAEAAPVSSANREGDMAIVQDNLTPSEMADFINLSNKALGKPTQSATTSSAPQINKAMIDSAVVESMQKAMTAKLAGTSNPVSVPDSALFSEEESLSVPEKKESDVIFVGDDEGVMAESIAPDNRRGVRFKFEGDKVAINIFEVMKDPKKLFPKASIQVTLDDFNNMFTSTLNYLKSK